MNQITEDVIVRTEHGPGPGKGEYTSTFVRVKITGEPYAVSRVKELISRLNTEVDSDKYVVWEAEYPEEGSVIHDASSAEEAMQKYSEDTGVPQSETELDACRATPAIIAAHLALE